MRKCRLRIHCSEVKRSDYFLKEIIENTDFEISHKT